MESLGKPVSSKEFIFRNLDPPKYLFLTKCVGVIVRVWSQMSLSTILRHCWHCWPSLDEKTPIKHHLRQHWSIWSLSALGCVGLKQHLRFVCIITEDMNLRNINICCFPEWFLGYPAIGMICDEHLELLLYLVPGDGGVGHDVVHILLRELHVGVLSPPLDPSLGQNVQSFVGLFLHYGNSHQASMC